jgi:hypothetical protein
MKGKIMALWDTFRHGGAAREKFRQVVPQPIRQDLRNLKSGNIQQKVGGATGLVGTAFGLPEFGLSEKAGQAKVYDQYGNLIQGPTGSGTTSTAGTTSTSDIDFSSSLYGDGSGGYSQADIDNQRAEIQKRMDSARGQIEGLYNREMTDLKDNYGRAKKEGRMAYDDMGRSIDSQNLQNRNQLDNFFTARGLADSSYRENATTGAKAEFQNALSRLGEAEAQYFTDLDSQLTRAQDELNRVKANFYNDLPTFGSMEEAISYGNQLKDQESQLNAAAEQLRRQVTQMASTRPQQQSENLMNISNMLGQIAGAAGTPQDKLRRAQQIVGSYFQDPKAREYYLDQFGFMMAQANGDQEGMRRIEEQLRNKYY